jgi:AraC-like DNA-binding protein
MLDASAPPPHFLATGIRRGRYLFLDTPRRAKGALVCAGWEECRPDYAIDRPSFRYHAVEFLAAGTWEVRTGGRWQPAAAGTVMAYGPHRHGGIRARGRGPHLKYFADFEGPPGLLAAARLDRKRTRTITHIEAVAGLFEQLVQCSVLSEAGRPRVANALLSALVARLAAEPEPQGKSSRQGREVFLRCRDHLVEHYPHIRGITAAARDCHVAPEYFSRLFRRHAGQTALEFLTRLRINHAAKLLQTTNLTVQAVGRAVGFDDPYHFSRVFKRLHGIAPGRFRLTAD